MNQPTILIAEDDPKTAALVRLYLEKNGYKTLLADNGDDALTLALEYTPHLIVLDIMLPGQDGLAVCRQLRHEPASARIPVIMLTARSTEMDTLVGLDVGADDYMTKPFSPRELVARVKTVLRRCTPWAAEMVSEKSFAGLTIYFDRYEVVRDGRHIELTPREFTLLATLAREPYRVFDRETLATRAFGHDYDGNGRSVDVQVMRLRKKIERDASEPDYIHTVYGVGYKFAPWEEST